VWESRHATHRGAKSQLCCVCPKRWRSLQCSESFGATYDSTDVCKPTSSFSDHTFDTSGPRATNTMKFGGNAVLGGGLVATRRLQLLDVMETNVQGSKLLSDIHLPMFFKIIFAWHYFGNLKVCIPTSFFPSRNLSALTSALNPSAVDGTTIKFSSFSSAVRPAYQDALNQAKKLWASPNLK